jgi:ribonuclease HI
MEITREKSNFTRQKSPLGLLKVNWDAALAKVSKQMGVGVVVWDVDGHYVALATVIPHITDPTTTKALAAWRAVMLCWDLGFTRFVMEGDSKTVALAINETSRCFSSYGHILEAIRNRLQAFP